MQGRNDCVCKLPHLAGRQLGTLSNIGSIEREQVVGGNEGLIERGQQMRIWLRVKVRQHLQQVRHGLLVCSIGAALRMARATVPGPGPLICCHELEVVVVVKEGAQRVTIAITHSAVSRYS